MHNVFIAGLGQVALGYDLNIAIDGPILTHARAFSVHSAFSLIGGYDPSVEQCRQYTEHYEGEAGDNLITLLKETQPDVVVIASPTQHHGSVLGTVLDHASPQIILCEKPLSFDLNEARAMVGQCHEHGILMYVNYLRRAEPGVREVKRRIIAGEIAAPMKGVAWYTKGLLHNGSHFVNLLEYWLGPISSFKIINAGRTMLAHDVEPDVEISFAKGSVMFLAAREEDYSLHEIDLVAPNGRLRYARGGGLITWQKTVRDEMVPDYKVLSLTDEEIESQSGMAQWHVVNQLATCLEGESVELCSGAQALESLEAVLNIKAAI